MQKAILVAQGNDINTINNSLDELKNLLNTIGINELVRFTQKLNKPNNKTYLGPGKIEELVEYIKVEEPDYVVFDDELSPLMLFNLEKAISVPILDRTRVILEIFKIQASSPLSKLEVELANLKYMLPRIESLSDDITFDRQGGVNNKGKGETKLELDKRILQNKIIVCEKKIEEIKKRTILNQNKRKKENIKNIALVGYTNAGKSSTMNALVDYLNKYEYKNNLKADFVEAEDKLFKTLSTSIKKLTYKNVSFYLSDTIGFINKLPHILVNSFYATLLEAKNADLLIIVLDISTINFAKEYRTTLETLRALNITNTPILLLLNKVDKIEAESLQVDSNIDNLIYSNKEIKYQQALLDYIYNFLTKDYTILDLRVPYTSFKITSQIEENTTVISKTYVDTYVIYKVNAPSYLIKELELYKTDEIIN